MLLILWEEELHERTVSRMISSLRYPLPAEGPRPEGQIGVADFPYDESYEDGMPDRVFEADKALKAYYAEQDAEKK